MPSFIDEKGFSLLELMVVVTIIGLLAMMAMPSYQRYATQARFAEVISAVHPFKLAVALALQEGIPRDELNHQQHGLPDAIIPTENLASIQVNQGVITATGTARVKNATYILTPDNEGAIWKVTGSCLAMGLCDGS
jgi:type IV pilus assembly protein PilA